MAQAVNLWLVYVFLAWLALIGAWAWFEYNERKT